MQRETAPDLFKSRVFQRGRPRMPMLKEALAGTLAQAGQVQNDNCACL